MAPAAPKQRCLYEVLEVSRDADEDSIKKAYRKQALMWHPDKNAHRAEEAAEKFKEIQNAYEILSDKHERAWYDDHRDQILRSGERHQAGGGGGGFEGSSGKPPEDEELFSFFTSSCYSGYGDGPKGFYGVYEAVFAKLAKQEQEAWERRDAGGAGGSSAPTFPGFGTSQSDTATVTAFYARWGSYTTCRNFAWADLYNPAAAPHRFAFGGVEMGGRGRRGG
ncbi:molecular chaperone [Volvox carteri f. nagariensis]|uniref:Molecular chaperone n=1 Tax=Volvox carteri f. nagariensis TaxID=3068 RepID=D8U394_VOLCA|nr:molecular chaperone [Volvox carteri f. nagariensis]EFJ45712.1 molecular chaperone [Volvox carteri f. nagariensis]|eukprot:XP_002953113.1 molecular chaperone [Volvox carteri f. nagariensis]